MQISAVGSTRYASYTRSPVAAPTEPRSTIADEQTWRRVQLRASELASRVVELRRLLESARVRSGNAVSGPGGATGTSVVSSTNNIGLDPTTRRSTLQSTEEVNTDTASSGAFDPAQPGWTGASTATPNVGGTYNGTIAETYTFEVVKTGNPSQKRPDQLTVTDSAGNIVDQFDVFAEDFGSTVYSLSSGMEVMFSPGEFVRNDSFIVNATPGSASTAEPDNPFNGTGAQSANLQSGHQVTDGSFTVNGTVISVSAGDTINSVLARITTATGITAAYDPGTELVTFTQGSDGPAAIDLADDTSGFLAAMKLDGAVTNLGDLHDAEEAMAHTVALGSVSAGSLLVNGASITVDPDVDSLDDILARINASGAGVTATRSGTSSVSFSGAAGATLSLSGGGTGFFAALHVAEGTFEPPEGAEPSTGRSRGTSGATARRIADATNELGKVINELMSTSYEGSELRRIISGFGNDMRRVATKGFGAEASSSTRAIGLRFDLNDGATSLFRTSHRDERTHASALGRDFVSFRDAMIGSWDGKGTSMLGEIERLATTLEKTARSKAVYSL